MGTRYTDFTTSSKWLFQNPNVEFININIVGFDAYKIGAVKITADARAAIDELMKAIEDIGYKSSYKTEIREARDHWEAELGRLLNLQYHDGPFKPEIAGHIDYVLPEFGKLTGSYLTQTRVLGLLNELLPEDAIVVGASGSLPGDMQRVWKVKKTDTYHMEYGFSCMGYEVNAALGVQLARPDREVYSIVGDGSYMMLHSELPTSIQENHKINVLLFDNMSFGCKCMHKVRYWLTLQLKQREI